MKAREYGATSDPTCEQLDERISVTTGIGQPGASPETDFRLREVVARE